MTQIYRGKCNACRVGKMGLAQAVQTQRFSSGIRLTKASIHRDRDAHIIREVNSLEIISPSASRRIEGSVNLSLSDFADIPLEGHTYYIMQGPKLKDSFCIVRYFASKEAQLVAKRLYLLVHYLIGTQVYREAKF